MDAAQRLTATSSLVLAKGPEVSEWWHHLEPEAKKQYISEHPNSKYADQAVKEGQEKGHEAPKESLKTDSDERKKMASGIRENAPKIASHIKHHFPKITHAVGALKNLATGKAPTHEQKEVLHEMGEMVIHNQLAKHVGGNAVHFAADIGITAIKYGIEKYKEHQAKNKDKDSVETFVESVAEGVEKAEHAPVPEEHAQPGSKYRTAIAKHLKSSVNHVANVIERTYPHLKPATKGLTALAKGGKPSHEEKHAIQHMGKHALMLGIAALPGGLAVHLTAGVGVNAVNYGIKKFRQMKNQNESPRSLVHHFVEAITEGVEHAFINNHLGGHHEGGGGHSEHASRRVTAGPDIRRLKVRKLPVQPHIKQAYSALFKAHPELLQGNTVFVYKSGMPGREVWTVTNEKGTNVSWDDHAGKALTLSEDAVGSTFEIV